MAAHRARGDHELRAFLEGVCSIAVVEEILSRLPRAVWMQLGIEHPEAAGRLEAAGVSVAQHRCLMVDHRRLFPA